jgi:hypothetical protein
MLALLVVQLPMELPTASSPMGLAQRSSCDQCRMPAAVMSALILDARLAIHSLWHWHCAHRLPQGAAVACRHSSDCHTIYSRAQPSPYTIRKAVLSTAHAAHWLAANTAWPMQRICLAVVHACFPVCMQHACGCGAWLHSCSCRNR